MSQNRNRYPFHQYNPISVALLMATFMHMIRFGRKSRKEPRRSKTPSIALAPKAKGYDQKRHDARNLARAKEKDALIDSREAWIKTTNQKLAARERARRAHERAAARG